MDKAINISGDGEVEVNLTKGFSRFPDRPTDSQISAIKAFVQETGHPEDHPDLCLAPPDLTHAHLIVTHLDVPLQRCRTEHPAWCSICKTWKFGDGRLIWCPDDGGLRPVGHNCADTHFGGKRWAKMEREYKRREAGRGAQDYLLDILPTLGMRADALVKHMNTARQLERAHDILFKGAPRLAEILFATVKHGGSLTVQRRASKGGPSGLRSSSGTSDFIDDEIGRLRGLPFLTRTYRPFSKLNKLGMEIRLAQIKNQDAALEWVARMSEDTAIDRAREIQRLLRRADKAVAKVEDAAGFLTLDNFETIRRWVNDPESPFQAEVSVTEKGLRVRLHGEQPVYVPMIRLIEN